MHRRSRPRAIPRADHQLPRRTAVVRHSVYGCDVPRQGMGAAAHRAAVRAFAVPFPTGTAFCADATGRKAGTGARRRQAGRGVVVWISDGPDAVRGANVCQGA